MPSALCTTRRGLAGTEGRHERWRCEKNKSESCYFRTFCVVWADSGRGGTPLGGARPHRYTTSGTKRDGVVSGICADVGTEDRTGVVAVDADFVPCDLPPGGGKVLLLPRRVTCWKTQERHMTSVQAQLFSQSETVTFLLELFRPLRSSSSASNFTVGKMGQRDLGLQRLHTYAGCGWEVGGCHPQLPQALWRFSASAHHRSLGHSFSVPKEQKNLTNIFVFGFFFTLWELTFQ